MRTVEIKIPVPVVCTAPTPARPPISTLVDILARPNAEAAWLLMAQHNALLAYVGELEAVANACASVSSEAMASPPLSFR